MSSSDSDRNPVEELAEEFADRFRRGERPSLTEYTDKYPQWAADIRRLFPALVAMERVRPEVERAASEETALQAGRSKVERLGDFRLLREIGRGGMGIVYEAEQESLGRRVALKVLSAAAMLDSRHLRRFEREAKAAARLHHTNIVPVYGVGEQNGLHYFVMQFIPGQGLDQVLVELRRLRENSCDRGLHQAADSSHGFADSSDHSAIRVAEVLLSGVMGIEAVNEPHENGRPEAGTCLRADAKLSSVADPSSILSPVLAPAADPQSSSLTGSGRHYWRSVARIGIQVADAMAYAQSQGVLHRDIKPSNLLLDTRGAVWVADFGLAKAAGSEDLTHTGDIVGTLRYMAPERFNGQSDIRSDIYGLGLSLYELLTLQSPFDETERHKLIQQVTTVEPPPPRQINAEIPHDLETIVLKAIAREPVHRYPTPTELADDLKRYLDNEPIHARRLSYMERLDRWCRRNPLLTVVSGVAALALGVVVALAGLFVFREIVNARALTNALSASEQSRRRAERLLAESYVDRGLALCESGEVGGGLLWLARSLELVPEGDNALQRTIRLNLGAWRRQLSPLLAQFPHQGEVKSVAFSPDGRTILTGSADRTARLWDVATGKPLFPPLTHPTIVFDAVFSPDGLTVLVAGGRNSIRIWNSRSATRAGLCLPYFGPVLTVSHQGGGVTALITLDATRVRLCDAASGIPAGPILRHTSSFSSMALSPDGRYALIGCEDKTVRLWQPAAGMQIGSSWEVPGEASIIAFSPNSRTAMVGCRGGSIRLVDTATGTAIDTSEQHQDDVRVVAFHPSSASLLTGSADKTARLWDCATGDPLGPPLPHNGWLTAVAFSPDGRTVFTGSDDNTARLWDPATAQPIGLPLVHPAPVVAVAFHPEGQSVLTGSFDGVARLWSTPSDQVAPVLEHRGTVNAVAFSPLGETILTGSGDQTARLWNASAGNPIGAPLQHQGPVEAVAFSRDGRMVLTGSWDNTARVWDAASGNPISPAEGMHHESWVRAVAFSPDGRSVLTGSRDKTARLWDAVTGQPVSEPLRHAHEVLAVAFSPDGRMILTGGGDSAQLRDVPTGKPFGPPLAYSDSITCAMFSPDGQMILAGGWGLDARLWDVATGKQLGLPLRHHSWVRAVAFSPNGRNVVTGSGDRSARIWDAATGKPVSPPIAHAGAVLAVAFSPDGQTVLIGGLDGTARLRDSVTGKQVGPSFVHRGMIQAAAFSPDGRKVVTASGDNTGRVWTLPEPWYEEVAQITREIQLLTGMELDPQEGVRQLDIKAWQQLR